MPITLKESLIRDAYKFRERRNGNPTTTRNFGQEGKFLVQPAPSRPKQISPDFHHALQLLIDLMIFPEQDPAELDDRFERLERYFTLPLRLPNSQRESYFWRTLINDCIVKFKVNSRATRNTSPRRDFMKEGPDRLLVSNRLDALNQQKPPLHLPPTRFTISVLDQGGVFMDFQYPRASRFYRPHLSLNPRHTVLGTVRSWRKFGNIVRLSDTTKEVYERLFGLEIG